MALVTVATLRLTQAWVVLVNLSDALLVVHFGGLSLAYVQLLVSPDVGKGMPPGSCTRVSSLLDSSAPQL